MCLRYTEIKKEGKRSRENERERDREREGGEREMGRMEKTGARSKTESRKIILREKEPVKQEERRLLLEMKLGEGDCAPIR